MHSGRKRIVLAAAAGALLTLALPPFHIVPVVLFSFPALLWLLEKCDSKRQAFWLGWWFGFAHHVAGLYWICHSLLVDAARFAWLIPFAISLIPAYLALYTGLVTWLTFRSGWRGWRRVVYFAGLWTLAEVARAYLLTGFPWNSIGYVWADTASVARLASIGGVYGLTLLTVLLAAMPVLFFAGRRKNAVWLNVCVLAIGVLAVVLVNMGEKKIPDTYFKVRVVQPNIRQEMKWDREYAMEGLMKHLELTREPYNGAPPQVVIWPESAIPFRLEEDVELRRVIADSLPPGAVVLVGGVRMQDGRVYNSLMAMNDDGEIIAVYDKHHLVPFGEYIPLRFLLPFVDKLTEGGMDFATGPGPQTLKLEGIPPFSPLICYEGIFSGQVKDNGDLPAWMVNITNDAWFGTSTGPYQHLAMARMRAVEEGIPLVRAANTGISFANGLPLALNTSGIIDADIPYAASLHHQTFYSRYGMITPLLCISVLLLVASRRRG